MESTTADDHDGTSSEQNAEEYVLGLLVDAGVPSRIGRWLQQDRLADRLQQGTGLRWRIELLETELLLEADGTLPIVELGRESAAEYGWDVTVVMSDLPRRTGTVPVLADYSASARVGMLSVPALGAFFTRARALRGVSHLVSEHLNPRRTSEERSGGEDEKDRPEPGHPANEQSAKARRTRAPLGHIESSDDEIDEHIALIGPRGGARLLAGMIRANRPWRLLPSLSPALAGAAAGSAFGIFYSNIWMLADAFSGWRFVMVGALAIAAMIIWIIADNGLWELSSDFDTREQVAIANTATTLTITIAVLYMYVLLYVITFSAALVVIPSSHLASNLGHSVGLIDYVTLAWLATSMGTIAGALGSGLSDEETVRQAAYSRREYNRRQRRKAEQSQAHHGARENQ